MVNCDNNKNNLNENVIILSSKKLIDIILAKTNNIQINDDSIKQFLHQRNYDLKHSELKFKNYLNNIKNDLQLILDKNYLVNDLEINHDNQITRQKRELKSNNQMSSPYFDRKLYIVNVQEEVEPGKFLENDKFKIEFEN